MDRKLSWIAAGAVIGGFAGVVVNLTVPVAAAASRVLGPAILVAGIVVGGIIGGQAKRPML